MESMETETIVNMIKERRRVAAEELLKYKGTLTDIDIINEYFSYELINVLPITTTDIYRAFIRANPKDYTSEEDYNIYKNLPDMVRVYRGCSIEELDENGDSWAISWTLDKKVAEFFAYRFNNTNGCVLTALVPKEDVRCYYSGGMESEVVILGVLSPKVISTYKPNVFDIHDFKQYQKNKYGSKAA